MLLLVSKTLVAQYDSSIKRILKESESVEFSFEKLIAKCSKKRERTNRIHGGTDNPFQVLKSELVDFISIPTYDIEKSANAYNGNNIIQHLKIDKRNLYGAIAIDNKKNIVGFFDFSIGDYNRTRNHCFFITNDSFLFNAPNFLNRGYQYILKHYPNSDLIFGVKYVNRALWFIKDGKVFVLDLPEMNVYTPDQFIASNCSDNFVLQVAKGNQNISCNF